MNLIEFPVDMSNRMQSVPDMSGRDFVTSGELTAGYVPYIGATANLNLGTFDLITDTVKASTSAGLLVKSNSGTDVALFGAGGGAGTTFYGGVILNTMTQGSVLFAGSSGLVSQDNSNLFWDDSNNRLGLGTGSSVGARLTVRTDGIGAAISESSGVLVRNGTTVPSGFSTQYSPPVTMVGYRRGFAANGEVKVAQYVKTNQFADQQWAVAMSIDGGAYAEIFNINDLGDATFTGEILGVTTMTVTGVLRGAFLYGDTTSGSAGSPTFSFFGDPDTGMFRVGADVIGFSTGGTQRMRVDSARALFSNEIEIDGALNHDGTTVGLYGVAPVVRATTGIAEAAFVENAGGTAVNVDSTFGGYTVQQVVQALQGIGILT